MFERSSNDSGNNEEETYIREAVLDCCSTVVARGGGREDAGGSRYVVFGSALGLLAFYGAVGLGWRSVSCSPDIITFLTNPNDVSCYLTLPHSI